MSYTDTRFHTFAHSHTSTRSSVFGRCVFLLLFHPSSRCLLVKTHLIHLACSTIVSLLLVKAIRCCGISARAPRPPLCFFLLLLVREVTSRFYNLSRSLILLFPFASWDRDIMAEAAWRSCTVQPLLRFSCFSAIISTLLDCFYLSSQYSRGRLRHRISGSLRFASANEIFNLQTDAAREMVLKFQSKWNSICSLYTCTCQLESGTVGPTNRLPSALNSPEESCRE